jgi:DNA-directed RNA polymerase specialized sigma24 family protein
MVSAEVAEDTRPHGGLAELYQRHAPAAGRLAYLLTGSHEQAEDLVQEAFVRVVGRFGHLRVPDAFPAYLRRTIENLHRSGLRRRRLERALRGARGGRPVEPVAPPDVGTREALWRALRTLPPRKRALVVRRYYEDLSEADTADADALFGRGREVDDRSRDAEPSRTDRD